ncbi:MAG: FHA domain-containing protein, partial [Myxococcales bacterium]
MPMLVAASGPRVGARFEIGAELVIGRSPSCEIALPDDGKVSRRHARLWAKGEQFAVEDLGSRNGTWVNGDRIEAEVLLSPGDRVQVGDTAFLFDPPVRAEIDDGGADASQAGAVEEFLPVTGEAAQLFRAATALITCASEASA